MIPTIVIVGRPNVGKSTLFNRFTRSRDALVADVPGLTRDRHYGRGRVGDKAYLVVDTGGLEPVAQEGILHAMAQQTRLAVDEADAVVLLVDGRQGLTPQDRTIAEQLRRTGRRIWVVVNKAEGMQPATVNAEFHELALGDPLAISAAHGDGVSDLADLITADFAVREEPDADAEAAPETRPRIAIVGRPNVGKSTLVNSLLGEERVLVFDQPGTTRDSIYVDFERDGRRYTLIDTAGMRRRGNIEDAVEKFSVIKTLQAIEDANVVILVLDAREPITDQDAHIAGFILEAGRALVVAVNKWDGLKSEERDWTKRSLARTLNFIEFAPAHYISALAGTGIRPLLDAVERAYQAAMVKLPTPKLTRALIAAVARQAPPRGGIFRPKLRYAHQGGSNPPRIVIHGTALNHISDSYRRYLERFFRETFQLQGTPLKIEFRQGRNPYDTRREKR
ncbi:MAG: ribosome biogenesis GTPase Der [Burkholderiales bacterium]|nr:ribosome biogenesis GTPase Der [Burkholderiales bacterium]